MEVETDVGNFTCLLLFSTVITSKMSQHDQDFPYRPKAQALRS